MARPSSWTPARPSRSWPCSGAEGRAFAARRAGRAALARLGSVGGQRCPAGGPCRRSGRPRAIRSSSIARGSRSPARRPGRCRGAWSGWPARTAAVAGGGGRPRARPVPGRLQPARQRGLRRLAGGPGGRHRTDRDDGPGPTGHGARGGGRPAAARRRGLTSPDLDPLDEAGHVRLMDLLARVGGSGGRASPVPAVCRDPRSGARRGAARVDHHAVRGDPRRRRAADAQCARDRASVSDPQRVPGARRTSSQVPLPRSRCWSGGMRRWRRCWPPVRQPRRNRPVAASPARPASARPGSRSRRRRSARGRHGPRRAGLRRRAGHRVRPDRRAAAFGARGPGASSASSDPGVRSELARLLPAIDPGGQRGRPSPTAPAPTPGSWRPSRTA